MVCVVWWSVLLCAWLGLSVVEILYITMVIPSFELGGCGVVECAAMRLVWGDWFGTCVCRNGSTIF